MDFESTLNIKGEKMPAASILIKPSSSNCNIDCKYCFYKCLSSNREKYSLGFMSETTLETLIKNAIDYAEGSLTFAFQGGEPTLIGIDFYKRAIELQQQYLQESGKKLVIENTLQTNGILIDDEWAEFFHENNFLVGLSFDGPRKLHDLARVDTKGNGTFDKLMNTVGLFRKHGVNFNILTVVTEETTKKASSLYNFYKRNGFDFIQLIPCMDEIKRNDENDSNPYAVTPESYGKFLMEIFDLWYEDFKNGLIMDIRMFSNLAQMAIGYPAEECGMNGCCNCYFVVEGDGSVYPCDFYCMDDYKLGDVGTSFKELYDSQKAKSFMSATDKVEQECKDCKYYKLCRGGCRRWRENDGTGKLGLNYLCPAYKAFFEHTQDRIMRLGKTIIDPKYRSLL